MNKFYTAPGFSFLVFFILISVQASGQLNLSLKNGNLMPEKPENYRLSEDKNASETIFTGIQISNTAYLEPLLDFVDGEVVSIIDRLNYIIKISPTNLTKLQNDARLSGLFDMPIWAKSDAVLSQFSLDTSRLRVMIYGSDGLAHFKRDFPDQMIDEVLITTNACFVTLPYWKQPLEVLTNKDYIAYVGYRPSGVDQLNFNKRAVESVQAANLSVAEGGLGLNGAGIVVGHGDGGQINHVDLNDRINNFASQPVNNHASHTGGTIGGAGNLNPRHRGIADQVSLLVHDSYNIILNSDLHYNGNLMRVTNNSYALVEAPVTCTQLTDYNIFSEEVDMLSIQHPDLLHVWASGNYGGLTCVPYSGGLGTVASGPQCSKNTITVNAVSSSEFYPLPGFTSRGPTADGRLKPEISAIGTSTTSCNVDNGYFSANGTSMATPSVTAATVLLQEAYKSAHGGQYPTSDLAKSILINTTDDLATEGPEFRYGYGMLNITNAAKQAAGNNHIQAAVTNLATQTYTITVPAGSSKLIVTLAWIDPAGNPASSIQLVNDLDLTVIGPSGTYRPWILNPDPAHATDLAVRGRDSLNNLEQVSLLAPTPGTYTIQVYGFAVMSSQNFSVTYRTVANKIDLQSPFGKEKYLPGENLYIHWDCADDGGQGFQLFLSTDDGSSWSSIATKAFNSRTHIFSIPNVNTNQAKVRIAHNGSVTGDTSMVFTIASAPSGLASSPLCEGYANLTWNNIATATGYNIFKKEGPSMVLVGTSATNSFQISGLNPTQDLFGVSALYADGIESRRSIGIFVTGGSGACGWDQDVAALDLLGPVNGRESTSTSLSASEPVIMRIKNIGANTINNFSVYYSINSDPPVTEMITDDLMPGEERDFTFSQTAPMSAPGVYSIEAGIFGSPDAPQDNNNVLNKSIRHLSNPPITLTNDILTTFREDFDATTSADYTSGAFGIAGADRVDFNAGSPAGRLRTFVTSGISNSGTQALSMDSRTNGTNVTNESILTLNLSNYNVTQNVKLHFSYVHHDNIPQVEDKLYFRGSDTDAWVELFDLGANQGQAGTYQHVFSLDLSNALDLAGQEFSSSTQLRFSSRNSSNIISSLFNDGITVDDVILQLVNADAALSGIQHPAPLACNLSSAEQIVVNVSNTSSTPINDAQLWYKLDNGTQHGPFVLPVLPAFTTIQYNLPAVNLSTFKSYNLDVWLHSASDDIFLNDSLKGYTFRNSPIINTFPYLEGFETNEGHWFSGGYQSSWIHTTPSKTAINRAANGSEAWTTGTSQHGNNEHSFLTSPCFDLSSFENNPVMSFSLAFDLETNYDYAWIEYSEDDENWDMLTGGAGQYNWYNTPNGWNGNSNYWHVATVPIDLDLFSDPAHVRFRFVMQSDVAVTREGISIDDIHIYTPEPVYSGSDVITSIPVSGSVWTPIYAGGQLLASLNPNGNNLGTVTTGVYFNPGTTPRNDGFQYYLDRNFTVVPSTPLSSGQAFVRLYFKDSEVNVLRSAPPGFDKPIDAYELGVTQFSSDTDDGVYGNEVNADVSYHSHLNTLTVPWMDGYYIDFPVNTFSEFYLNAGLAGNDTPLPIELLSFTGELLENKKTGHLKYSLSDNSDVKSIELQRASQASFDSYSHLTTFQAKSGEYNDRPADAGRYYYRLKLEDEVGQVSYSRIISINYPNVMRAFVEPNPSDGHFILRIQGLNPSESAFIQCLNMRGNILAREKIFQGNSDVTRQLNWQFLEQGVYAIRILQDDNIEILKIIILE